MKHSHPKGFMAIVAIGIFALLMIFGLTLQKQTMNTYGNIKDNLNYMYARNRADSIMEYLQLELSKHDVGYNTGNITCAYGKYATNDVGGCKEFDWVVDQTGVTDVKIVYSIKGRAEESEKITTTTCISGCYVVPFQGTGDAGKNCNITSVTSNLDPTDNSCNWNRLTFGSSTTDRVAIPLYYEKGLDQAGAPILVNPYEDKSATQLLFRLRTPCLPCVYDKDNLNPTGDVNRLCEKGANTTVCTKEERYELDDGGSASSPENDVVVQWQLSGKCEDGSGVEKDCSVLPIAGDKENNKSAIYESRINGSQDDNPQYGIINNMTQGNDVSVHPPKTVSIILEKLQAPAKLPLMKQPILNIFLSNSLISNEKKNVPYLEYQLLTNRPIGSPKVKLEAEVTVNGNTFKKTLYKEIKKDLVDFAIQN